MQTKEMSCIGLCTVPKEVGLNWEHISYIEYENMSQLGQKDFIRVVNSRQNIEEEKKPYNDTQSQCSTDSNKRKDKTSKKKKKVKENLISNSISEERNHGQIINSSATSNIEKVQYLCEENKEEQYDEKHYFDCSLLDFDNDIELVSKKIKTEASIPIANPINSPKNDGLMDSSPRRANNRFVFGIFEEAYIHADLQRVSNDFNFNISSNDDKESELSLSPKNK